MARAAAHEFVTRHPRHVQEGLFDTERGAYHLRAVDLPVGLPSTQSSGQEQHVLRWLLQGVLDCTLTGTDD